MALRFTAASSQYLECVAPTVTDYPFSVGMWVRRSSLTGSNRTVFGLSDTGTTNHRLIVRMTTTETLTVGAQAGGTLSGASPGTAIAAGQWAFVVGRFISSTERSISQAQPTFAGSGNGATTRAPTGLDTVTVGAGKSSAGASEFWDGDVAELWIARGDCYGTAGADMDPGAIVSLAYNGPFGTPFLRERIVEYRSFLQGIVSPGDLTRMQFTEINGPIPVTDHPPLLPGYRRAAAKYAPLTV